MFLKKLTSMLIITLVLTGFFFLAAPEQSNAGVEPIGQACCQFADGCIDFSDIPPGAACLAENVVDKATCNEKTGLCTTISAINPVPTLSEWGLIAMAAVLGIAGYLIVRRKRVST